MTSDANPGTGGADGEGRRQISDARTMRALAHPVRIALLEALRREGTLTATRAAELLGDSPGNMSWHLQTLAKYGFVAEAGGGRGRSRPWRALPLILSVEAAETGDDAERAAAGEALAVTFVELNDKRLRQYWSLSGSYPAAWRKAAFFTGSLTFLTAEEMKHLSDEVDKLLVPYLGRTRDKAKRPPDALPVQFVAYAHPLPPTPSGN